MQDKACRVSAFCKFVSVLLYIITTFMVIALALAVSVWLILDIYILVPGRGNLLFANLLGILGAGLGWFCVVVVLYGAILLWEKRKLNNRIYRIYQVASIVLAVALLVFGIMLNAKRILGLSLSFIYYPLILGSFVSCGIAFGMKCKEIKTEREKEKKQDSLKETEYFDNSYSEESIRDTVMAVMEETEYRYGIRAIEGEYAGAVFEMKDGENLIFGTHPKYCHIVIRDPKISRTHCIVSCQSKEKKYLITDCSKNGTFLLNGERLPFGIACAFPAGTIFCIRTSDQMFQLL